MILFTLLTKYKNIIQGRIYNVDKIVVRVLVIIVKSVYKNVLMIIFHQLY